LDSQEINLDSMVQLKLYSFCHYLKKINFKGFTKWVVLNQCIKEEHPQQLSLMDIIKNNRVDASQTGTLKGSDEIYISLL